MITLEKEWKEDGTVELRLSDGTKTAVAGLHCEYFESARPQGVVDALCRELRYALRTLQDEGFAAKEREKHARLMAREAGE